MHTCWADIASCGMQKWQKGSDAADSPAFGLSSSTASPYTNFYRRPTDRRQGKAMVASNISFQRSHVQLG
jgi:hypothetical protein